MRVKQKLYIRRPGSSALLDNNAIGLIFFHYCVLIMSKQKISESIISCEDGQELSEREFEDLLKLEKPWWNYSYLRYLHFCIFLATLTSTNNGYDGSMLNGLQSLASWRHDLNHPTGQRLGALSNGCLFGTVASFPFASWLSDKYGRKAIIMVGNTVTVIGAILQGASNSYGFFLASRVIIGLGAGIATVSSPSLISEISYPTYRPTTTTFYNVCWYLGAFIAAWVTYGTRTINSSYSWKIPSYLQAAMPLCQVVLFWWVPESPRYLVAKGRFDEASAVLSKIHAGGGTDERSRKLVAFELREIQAAIELERLSKNTRYIDFLTIPSFRKRLFLTMFTGVMMQLSGNGLVSYYLNKVLDSIGITGETRQLQINGALMAYNLVIASVIASFVGRFRRRTLFLFCTSTMLLSYVIWTALSAINEKKHFADKSYANGVLAMIFLYYFAYNVGMNGLPFLYITEVLPYSHRTKGINIFQLTQQVVLVYNGYVNPIAMDAISWKYYIVYCCILACEVLIVYFFYLETSGYTLEEVARVFGDDSYVSDLEASKAASHGEKLSLYALNDLA